MFKTNQDITMVVGSEIEEWDIHSGNASIMAEYHLASIPIIQKILNMPKTKRNVYVGNMMKGDKQFSKNLEAGFDHAVSDFITQNNLTWDDILSIKRDAVFVKNVYIKNPDIGKFIHFVKKNSYCAYIKLGTMEIYFRKDGSADIKGIIDGKIGLHEDGMLTFLRQVIQMKAARDTKKNLHQFVKEFSEAYKRKELDFPYYREMNSDSMYSMHMEVEGEELRYSSDEIDESMMDDLDISFNFKNVILPLIQIIL